jgi:hypothetical protein
MALRSILQDLLHALDNLNLTAIKWLAAQDHCWERAFS